MYIFNFIINQRERLNLGLQSVVSAVSNIHRDGGALDLGSSTRVLELAVA